MAMSTVLIFWHSDHDAKRSVREYVACVRNAPALKNGCDVDCRDVDVTLGDPANKHWSGKQTIEVVGVTAGKAFSPVYPTPGDCSAIEDLVRRMCNAQRTAPTGSSDA